MENKSFLMGLRDGTPICLGYLTVSFAFGIFATGSGLGIFEALLISMFNVTSAGQLAAVPIIAVGGSFVELALTQLVINMRYALMSISLSQKLGKSVRFCDRFLLAFMNTDEIFAVASGKEGSLGRKYMFGLILFPYFGWAMGTLIGAVAGNVLPEVVTTALEIAIYGMFVAIVVPFAKASLKGFFCVALAAGAGCAFYYIPVLSSVPKGFSIIIITILVSTVCALLFPVKEERCHE